MKVLAKLFPALPLTDFQILLSFVLTYSQAVVKVDTIECVVLTSSAI